MANRSVMKNSTPPRTTLAGPKSRASSSLKMCWRSIAKPLIVARTRSRLEDAPRSLFRLFPDLGAEFNRRVLMNKLPEGWESALPTFPADPKGMATRAASGKVINAIAAKLPELIGGSADLAPRTIPKLTAFLPSKRIRPPGAIFTLACANMPWDLF
jgi:hypothetical protein